VSVTDAACEVTPLLGYSGIHMRFKHRSRARKLSPVWYATADEGLLVGVGDDKYYALLRKRVQNGELLAPKVRPVSPACCAFGHDLRGLSNTAS
jgi:hypothetical protein